MFKSANRNWNFPQDKDFQARFIPLNPPNLPPIFTVGLGLTAAAEVVKLFRQEDRTIEWISAPENPPDCVPRSLINISISEMAIISPDWAKLSPDEQRILAPGQQSSWLSQCMELTGLSTVDLADQKYIALSHLQAVRVGQFRSFGELLRHLHRHVKHTAVSLKIFDDTAIQSTLTICFQLILQTAIKNLDQIIGCQLFHGVLLRRPPTDTSVTSTTLVPKAENNIPAATDQNSRKEMSSQSNTNTAQAVPVNLSNATSINVVRTDNENHESTNSISILKYQSHVENATQTSSHGYLSSQNKAAVSPRGPADEISLPSLTPYWASQQKREPLLYRIEEEQMSKTSQVRSLEDLCSPLGDARAVCNLDPAEWVPEKNRPRSSCEIPTPDRFNSRSTFMSALSPNSNDHNSDDDEDLEIQQKPTEDTRNASPESADDLYKAWLSIISMEHIQSPPEQNINVSGDQTFDSLSETFIEQQKHPDVRGQLCKRIISRIVVDLISRCQCCEIALYGFVQSFHSQSVIQLTNELVDQVMAVTLTYRMNQMKFSSTEELSQLVATAPINVGLVIDQIMLENTASNEGFQQAVKTIKPPGHTKICRLCAELVDLIIESNPNLKPNFFDGVKKATSSGAVDALFSLAYPAACYAMNHVMQSSQTSPEISGTTAGQINMDSEIDHRHSHSTQSEEKPTHDAATKSSSLTSQTIVTNGFKQTALHKELENAVSLHSACSCVSESGINAVYTKITQLPTAASNQPLTAVTPVATAEEELHSDQADESLKSVGWKTPQSSAEFVLEVSPSVKHVDSKNNQMLPVMSALEADGNTEADEEKSCIVVSSTDGDCYSPHPVTGERFNASRIVRAWSFRSSRSDCPNDCSAAGSIYRSNPEHSLDPPNMSSPGYVQQESGINVHINFRLPDSSPLGEIALEPVRVRTQTRNASWKDVDILVDDGETGVIQFCPQCSRKLRTCIEHPDDRGPSKNITGSVNVTRDDGVQYDLASNEDKRSQNSIRVVPEDHGGREPSSLCDADCEIMRNLDRDLVNLSEDSSSTLAQKETHLVLECTVSKGPSPNMETREELDSSPSVVFRSLSMSLKDVRTKRRAGCKSYSCSRLQNMNKSDRANVYQTGDNEVYRDERTTTRSIKDEVDRTEDEEVMIVAEGASRTPTTEEEKTLSQGPQNLCYKGDDTEEGPGEIVDQSLVARKSRVRRGSKGRMDKRSTHFTSISPFYTCLEELRDCLRKAEERLSEVNSMSKKNPKFSRLRSRRKICARIVRRSPMKKRLKSRRDEKDLSSWGPSDENHYVSQVDLSEFHTQDDLAAQKHSSHPNLLKSSALVEYASPSDASPQTQKRGHKSTIINKRLQAIQSSQMKRTPVVSSFHLRGPISYFPAPSMELPVRANMTFLNSLHQSFVDEYSHQFVRRVQQTRKTSVVNSNIIKVLPALTGPGEKAHRIGHIGAILTHSPQHARSSCRLCSACTRDA